MTDYTDPLTKSYVAGHDPNVAALDADINQMNTERQAETEAAATESFRKGGLANQSLPMDGYDYGKLQADGVTFNDDTTLDNRYVKPATVAVAGRDLATGEHYWSDFGDPDGLIAEGVSGLSKSKMNVQTGPPPDDSVPLSSIGLGVLQEGGGYDDFVKQVPPVWKDEQKMIAWKAANQANDRAYLEENLTPEAVGEYGADFQMEPPDEFVESEADLINVPTYMDGAKTMYEYMSGSAWTGTPQELHTWAKWQMSMLNNMTLLAGQVSRVSDGNQKFNKAFYDVMRYYQATDMEWAQFGRGVAAFSTDLLNLTGFGLIAKTVSRNLVMRGVSKYLAQTIAATAAGAAEGGVWGGAEAAGTGYIEQEGGGEKLTAGKVALGAGLGVAAGAGLGGFLGAAAPPAIKWAQGVIQKNSGFPSLSDMHRQIGAVSTGESVRFRGVNRNERGMATETHLTTDEVLMIDRLAADGYDPSEVGRMILETKARFPLEDFAPLEAVGVTIKSTTGKPEIKWKKTPYGFHQMPDELQLPSGRVALAGRPYDPTLARRIKDTEKRARRGSNAQRREAEGRLADYRVEKQAQDARVNEMATGIYDEIKIIKRRAEQNPDSPEAVMWRNRKWYSKMQTRLREEFGSFGDVMADVLGTTSAQTNVRENWNNTIETLREFSRGKYDVALAKLETYLDAGGTITEWRKSYDRVKKVSGKAAADAQFPLITKGSGQLFNANSPQTMMALLDLFRMRKQGDSPKTPNFTRNLIGGGDRATIDVWAARHLRRLAGMSVVPTVAEQGVSGTHMADPALVGGEFGMGQEVLDVAAKKINQHLIKGPGAEKLNPDDLQAVVWFLEKEEWTRNNWTTAEGEGGSLEFEADLAGQPAVDTVSMHRKTLNADDPSGRVGKAKARAKSATERLSARQAAFEKEYGDVDLAALEEKARTFPKSAEAREWAQVKKAQKVIAKEQMKIDAAARDEADAQDYNAGQKVMAEEAIEDLKAPVRRVIGGVSFDQNGVAAPQAVTDAGMNSLQTTMNNNPDVLFAKVTPTKGRYIDPQGKPWDENSFDIEAITYAGADITSMRSEVARLAKANGQESAFISEVVDIDTPGSNPGLEVYFGKRVDEAGADEIAKYVNESGLDVGFTYATDYRAGDRAGVKGEFVGIRMQYVPEYGPSITADEAVDKITELLIKLENMKNVTKAIPVGYKTEVMFAGDYDAAIKGDTRRVLGEGPGQAQGQREGAPDLGPDGEGGSGRPRGPTEDAAGVGGSAPGEEGVAAGGVQP